MQGSSVNIRETLKAVLRLQLLITARSLNSAHTERAASGDLH